MTLIVALKYKDGVILASDSRVMYGPTLKRDQARKLEPLTENIGVAAAGLVGAIDDIFRMVKEFCSSRVVTFDDVVFYLSDVNYKWFEEKE
jgi:20S proteasome alpha/beta subunit